MENKFTVWETNINDSVLGFLEENFRFEDKFINLDEDDLSEKNIVVLNCDNKPVSLAIIDTFNRRDDAWMAEEVKTRFYSKMVRLEKVLEKNSEECSCTKNEIEQLKKDAILFRENDFCYIFYIESNEKNKGYATLLVSYLKDKYKYVSALPMSHASLKVFIKNKFKDIDSFAYAISKENEKFDNSLISKIESPFV